MKLGFIGLGVVGAAVKTAFSEVFETVGYDLVNSPNTREELLTADILFLSLPTPTVKGRQDQSALHSTCEWLSEQKYKGVVVIKSTVTPGTCHKLGTQFGLKVIHNPEFLTEARPIEDFISQEAVLLGGDEADADLVGDAFRAILPQAIIFHTPDSRTTEIAKYTHNLYLATKVGFMNEIYEVCVQAGVEYDTVLTAAMTQGKIGKSHTRVPNVEAKSTRARFGFGGMCFCKDLQALISWAEDQGLVLKQMNATNEANLKRRPETSLK